MDRRYNVNADTAAGAVAAALQAKRLLLLTDVAGVLDKQGQLIREIRRDQVDSLDARWHDLRRYDSET